MASKRAIRKHWGKKKGQTIGSRNQTNSRNRFYIRNETCEIQFSAQDIDSMVIALLTIKGRS